MVNDIDALGIMQYQSWVSKCFTLPEAAKAAKLARAHPPTRGVVGFDLTVRFYFRLVLGLSQAIAISYNLLPRHESDISRES